MPPNVTVSDLLLEWEARAVAGRPVAPEELCRTRPELLGELRRCIDLLQYVSPLLDLDGATAGGAAPAIPGFEVLDCLGGGGMGVVYRARDTALERVVAIKMPHLRILGGETARQRFEREARVLAQMRHPNIVPVHAVGLADGQPYFVMDYIPQGSLAGQAPRLTGQVRVIADIMEKVARAVHYAHERGILHRDLKPSNILLDERGQPLVADFGLAKTGPESGVESLSTSGCAEGSPAAPGAQISVAQLTLPGTRPGTPLYMAPEQMRGEPQQVTGRADVWALGVILFELLTGRPPFAPTGEQNTAAAVCEQVPPSPRGLCRGVDTWLESIVLKCLEKDPARRYASAAALADDMARWRRGDPPSTVREGRVRGLLRRVRRRPALATAAALLLAFAGLVGAGFLLTRPEDEEASHREKTRAAVSAIERQEPIDLIGDKGPPVSFLVRTGKAFSRVVPTQDGTFSVHAAKRALFELMPQVPADSYCFSAEVREDGCMDDADLGLYWEHQQVKTDRGTGDLFSYLRFADLGPASVESRDPRGRPGSRFALRWLYYREPGLPLGQCSSCEGPSQAWYQPPPPRPPGPWRKLSVEVTPERVQGRVDDVTLPVFDRKGLSTWVSTWPLTLPEVRQPPGPPARGGLGLYVNGCQASFRNCRVVPFVNP